MEIKRTKCWHSCTITNGQPSIEARTTKHLRSLNILNPFTANPIKVLQFVTLV